MLYIKSTKTIIQVLIYKKKSTFKWDDLFPVLPLQKYLSISLSDHTKNNLVNCTLGLSPFRQEQNSPCLCECHHYCHRGHKNRFKVVETTQTSSIYLEQPKSPEIEGPFSVLGRESKQSPPFNHWLYVFYHIKSDLCMALSLYSQGRKGRNWRFKSILGVLTTTQF